MELRHLRYFLAVAEHLNFSEASRRLHVAQPAISQTILDLEEELGVKLLLRTRRSVQLTASGNVFRAEAREILRRSKAAVVAAQRAARGEVGSLSIGFIPSASAPILPDLVEAYRSRFPDVAIQLSEMSPEQQFKAFEDKRIDLGFSRRIPKELPIRLNEELIYNDRLLVALPESHPLAGRKRVPLDRLATEPFIQFHRAGAPSLFDEVVAACRNAGFTPNVVHEPDLMNSVMLFVESGLGISLVPGCVRNLNHPKAVLRPMTPASAKIPLCAIWPQDSGDAPALEGFLDLLRGRKPDIQRQMES